jgi:hypothetical protein
MVAGFVLLALAGTAGVALERSGGTRASEELAFFPSGRLLPTLSLGHPTLLADATWLSAIQYYGKHHLGDRRYPLAEHLFDVTTRLDPQFRNAYIFAGFVLGEDAGDMDAARRVLTRGMAANPGDWMVAFQRGFLEYMCGDRPTGAAYMDRASRMPGAPPYTRRLAANACLRTGRHELAVRLWEEIAWESEDEALRELARRKLDDLRRSTPGSTSRHGDQG